MATVLDNRTRGRMSLPVVVRTRAPGRGYPSTRARPIRPQALLAARLGPSYTFRTRALWLCLVSKANECAFENILLNWWAVLGLNQ